MSNTNDGKRLEKWRESLPRASRAPMAARSLSIALDWEMSRWRQLEHLAKWSAFQRGEVERGVRALCERLDVDAATPELVVAHVLDGAPAPKLGEWREGQCPALPMGRPAGTGRPIGDWRALRRRRGDDDEDPRDPDPSSPQSARPILPEQVWRTQVASILRALEDGEIDRRMALDAIADIQAPLRLYYNKHEKVERP